MFHNYNLNKLGGSMKKLLLLGLLLTSVLSFTGCSMMSSFSEGQHINGQEVTYYEFHIKQAKKEYELCSSPMYYKKHQTMCISAKLALKERNS
jgi:hypothetical protein